MLESLEPIQLIALGATASALILLPAAVIYRNRARDFDADAMRAEKHAKRTRDILAATPDGLFLWDHATGGISCSRRLADILKLEAGTLARYDDIRACFDERNLQMLEQGVSLLRAKGSGFEIALTRGDKTFHVVGGRASDTNGRPVADIVWMRDLSDAGNVPVPAPTPAPTTTRNASGLEDKHLTSLLDTLPVPVWLRDANLNIAFLNRAAEKVRGLDPALADRARKDGKASTIIGEMTVDGRAMELSATETPLSPASTDGIGGTIGFAVPAAAPAKPQGSEKGVDPVQILRPLEAGVAVFDADTTLVAANTAFADLWRLDPDWLDTRPTMSDLLLRLRDLRRLPEVTDFRDFRRHELDLFETLTRVVEDELYLPDGRSLRRRIGPLSGGGIVMSYVDVSENLGLQRSLKSLDRVQQTTLENLTEGIAVFGGDGRLKLTNPRLAEIWAFEPSEMGEDVRLPDFIERLGMRMAATDDPWDSRKNGYIGAALSRQASENQVELVDGRQIAFTHIPLPDGATLISYTDVTDTYRVEAALRERARTLVEADRMKTEFIANVAMEVRTPLNSILGFADILRQEMFGKLSGRQMDYANGIHDTAENMMSVLGDILDLATIEAGQMELDLGTADAHGVLLSAFNMIKERARQKNIKLNFECPPDIGVIVTDSKRLTQIVFNLLTNAVWFTPKLGHVTLSAERADPWITIRVADSGPGIPKDERDDVFQPFAQGATSEHSGEGPGLGLTIVKRFVELHGGSVEIRSNKAKGTTIIVRVPTSGVIDAERSEGLASVANDHVILEERAAE